MKFERRLIDKFKYPNAVADEVITVLRSRMKVVDPSPLEIAVCRDSDDDKSLL
jgi:hypothetical protein